MNFFGELKRRNVFRVGFAYALVGWLVAQVADLALESFGAPDWVMKTLLFLLLIGFLAALFIAWAYEITPEGIKRAEDIDPDQSIAHQTGRKLDRLVIVVLLVSVALLLFDRFQTDSPTITQSPPEESTALSPTPATQVISTTPPENDARQETESVSDELSVAVLPFVNMSSDPEQEYFSDGISEEILNVLTRIPNLKVAARTSSFQFKGKNLDIADISKQLQVNHLLEGSVRKSGNTLRITAQLVETDTGFHLWSETFDRKLEDVFAIQDEIAAAIAVELRALLSGELGISSTPVDMQAYELYLKGRGLVASRNPNDLLEGINTLNEALQIEPEYAAAMATLAKAYVVLPFFSNAVPAREAREQARKLARQSLEIDAQNVEALSVLAIVYNELDVNPVGAIELLERAVKLNPGSVVANNFLGDLYHRIADLEKAYIYESRAAELDPLGPIQLTDLSSIFLLKGDYDKAMSLLNRALALDPTFLHALYNQGLAFYFLGDARQLERVFQTMSSLPNIQAGRLETLRNSLLLAQGNLEGAEKALMQNFQMAKAGKMEAVFVATSAARMGKFDIAGQMLLQAYREKDGRWISPLFIRLPEQAPDSEPWQDFWSQPGLPELAELRRSNGLKPDVPVFGGGTKP